MEIDVYLDAMDVEHTTPVCGSVVTSTPFNLTSMHCSLNDLRKKTLVRESITCPRDPMNKKTLKQNTDDKIVLVKMV